MIRTYATLALTIAAVAGLLLTLNALAPTAIVRFFVQSVILTAFLLVAGEIVRSRP